MPKETHVSVLLQEAVDGLNLKEGDVVVDATLGNAGHSLEICKRIGEEGHLIGIDQDPEAIEAAGKRFTECERCTCRVDILHGNFRDITKLMEVVGVGRVNAFLFDLGVRTEQIFKSGRGFSFKVDEPLDMRMNPKSKLTAETIVNDWPVDALKIIIKSYSDERCTEKIVSAIEAARERKRIESSQELASIVYKAVPLYYRKGRIHPATRTFQALRIAVNDELEALKVGLEKAFVHLAPGGRIAVISFHSIEDRFVKQFFKNFAKEGALDIVTKKPIAPTREEITTNPRSRSAKLRIAQKPQLSTKN